MPSRTLCTVISFANIIAACSADKVDDFVVDQMKQNRIVGCTVGVLINSQVVKLQGYGYSNLEHKTPATAETVYEIGSLTKQFTAEAILMLVEDGKLSLDDTVGQYLPDCPPAWVKITVRQLLTHESGIRNFMKMPEIIPHLYDSGHEPLIHILAGLPLDFVPGSDCLYSNSGYYLLGMIIEKVSGMPYQGFLKQRIFRPLHMDSARLNTIDQFDDKATGYVVNGKSCQPAPYPDLAISFAAGSLSCSGDDFGRWAAALFSRKLLKSESYDAMYSRAVLNDGSTRPYGFGWYLDDFRGHQKIFHTADISGFESAFVRWPKDGISVFVLTNTQNNLDVQRIACGICGLYNPQLTPFAFMSSQQCPMAHLSDALMGVVSQFGSNDINSGLVTDALKQAVRSSAQTLTVFKEMKDHTKTLEYLDEDETSPPAFYFRAKRDDGDQYVTVFVENGLISGIQIRPPETAPAGD